jgi:hypothetical protein
MAPGPQQRYERMAEASYQSQHEAVAGRPMDADWRFTFRASLPGITCPS